MNTFLIYIFTYFPIIIIGLFKENELPNPTAMNTTAFWTGSYALIVISMMAIFPPILYHSRALNELYLLFGICSVIYRGGVHYRQSMTKVKTDCNGDKFVNEQQ